MIFVFKVRGPLQLYMYVGMVKRHHEKFHKILSIFQDLNSIWVLCRLIHMFWDSKFLFPFLQIMVPVCIPDIHSWNAIN